MTNVSSLKERISLSGNALKLIAIIAMTVDHLAWMGIEDYAQALTPAQIILHCIGRLTAPITFFFVAEGYHHTRDYWKYLVRMTALALVSHFAFCYFAHQSFNPFGNELFNAMSIIWALMWGLIFLKVWYEDPKAWKKLQKQAMAEDFSWKQSALRYRARHKNEREAYYANRK